MSREITIGPYSAYAIAVKYGYTGTEQQWIAEQEASRLAAAQSAADASAAATRAENAQRAAEAAKGDALDAIGSAKTAAVTAVTDTKNTATKAVQAAQDTATKAVSATQSAATAAVEKKGKDVLATIPEDYTALIESVGQLKEDVTNLSDYTTQRIGVRIGSMYSTGKEGNETNRCKTYPISCKEVKIFKIVKPNTIAQTLYMCYKNGAWTTNGYTGYTLVGNTLTITDSEIEKVLIVFKNATDSDITAEEIGGTYLIPYIDVYERLDSGESDIRILKNRSEYSTARYQTVMGTVDIRNNETEDTKYIRTPEIDTRYVKQFKQIVASGCVTHTIIALVDDSWINRNLQVDNNIVTVDDDINQLRIVYKRSDGEDVTTDDINGTYLIPYIDAFKAVSEIVIPEPITVNRTNATFVNTRESSDRFVHNARRSGNGKVPVWTIIDDDGRVDALDVWLPMLKRNDFTMTIPLITSKIGVDENWLTWDGVKTMSDAGAEICSHTHTHPSLIDITEDEMRTEFATSISTLAEHGYYSRHLVYPKNKHNEIVRRIASEYFDCAVAYSEGSILENVPPVRTYRLSRQEIGKENQTIDDYKTMIDSCIENKSWLITMSHSQSAYMFNPDRIEEAIQYAIENGVKVISLGEALKIFGNVIECGVDTDGINYTGLDADGKPFGRMNTMIVQTPPSDFNGSNIFDCFPRMTKVSMSITSANGYAYGFPEGSSGGVLDIFVHTGNYYSYMDFKPLGGTKVYHREYSSGWGDWSAQGQFASLKIGSTVVTEDQLKSLIALLG